MPINQGATLLNGMESYEGGNGEERDIFGVVWFLYLAVFPPFPLSLFTTLSYTFKFINIVQIILFCYANT